jgi:hypothetical protein
MYTDCNVWKERNMRIFLGRQEEIGGNFLPDQRGDGAKPLRRLAVGEPATTRKRAKDPGQIYQLMLQPVLI